MSGTIDKRIDSALVRVRAATKMPVAFAGTVQSGALRLGHVIGQEQSPLEGVEVDAGFGLGGQVMAMRRPIAIEDYFPSTSIRHRYDHIIRLTGLTAMVAFPVIVRREQVSVVYVAHPHATTFGSRIFDAIATEVRELEQELSADVALESAGERVRDGLNVQSVEELYGELRSIANRIDNPEVRAELRDAAARLLPVNQPGVALTPREVDVIALAARGFSNSRIADSLGITLYTAKSYMKSSMRKLEAETRYEAVFTARRLMIIP
ncbi:MAG: LuxR C-terminal-related transcriptional regulator [Actinomycetota bacterium]